MQVSFISTNILLIRYNMEWKRRKHCIVLKVLSMQSIICIGMDSQIMFFYE